MVHSQSILITAVKWNCLIFTIILHNFLNTLTGIEQTFQCVFKSSVDPIFCILEVKTSLGFHICDILFSFFFFFFFSFVLQTLLAIWFLCCIFLIMRMSDIYEAENLVWFCIVTQIKITNFPWSFNTSCISMVLIASQISS